MLTRLIQRFKTNSEQLRNENAKLARDYNTVRDHHDALLLENERLRAVLKNIVNGPRDADVNYAGQLAEIRCEARAAITHPTQ
jgi:hypothetical protein